VILLHKLGHIQKLFTAGAFTTTKSTNNFKNKRAINKMETRLVNYE